MKTKAFVCGLLAFVSCRAPATPVARTSEDANHVARSEAHEPHILAKIAARFGEGISANQLADWTHATSPLRQGNAFVISPPGAAFTFSVVAASNTEAAPWIMAEPTRGSLSLSDLVAIFGKYRALPRGEQTWVVFDAVPSGSAKVSALITQLSDEAASRVIRVQFQSAI
jgi:hypothetical protein